MTAASEQDSITIPGVTVRPATLTVNRVMTGAPPAQVIASLVVNQQFSVGDVTDNPNTEGFSNFTWTWRPPAGTASNDLDAMLHAAGWDTALPSLDPSVAYTIAVTGPGSVS